MALSTKARIEMAMGICTRSVEKFNTDWEDENDPATILRLKTVCLKVITETLMRKDDREARNCKCKAPLWKLSIDQDEANYENKIILY